MASALCLCEISSCIRPSQFTSLALSRTPSLSESLTVLKIRAWASVVYKAPAVSGLFHKEDDFCGNTVAFNDNEV